MARARALLALVAWAALVLVASPRAQGLVDGALAWDELRPLPDPVGFAGAFAGVSNGALVVAGGANFPEGTTKVWHDRVFVLEDPAAEWRLASTRLPRPTACKA